MQNINLTFYIKLIQPSERGRWAKEVIVKNISQITSLEIETLFLGLDFGHFFLILNVLF